MKTVEFLPQMCLLKVGLQNENYYNTYIFGIEILIDRQLVQ